MTLLEAAKNKEYTVRELKVLKATQIRLQALGLTNGTQIRILNKKRCGSVIFMVRGTRLAVGEKIAAAIMIEEEK